MDLVAEALEELGLESAQLSPRIIVISDVGSGIEVVGYVLEHSCSNNDGSEGNTYYIVRGELPNIPLSEVLQKHDCVGEARPGEIGAIVNVLQEALEINVRFGGNALRCRPCTHPSDEPRNRPQGDKASCVSATLRLDFFRHVTFWL